VTATTPTPKSLSAKDRGAWADVAFKALVVLAAASVLAILALIAFSMTKEAWPALKEAKFHFVTSKNWVPNDVDGIGPLKPSFGALAFIYGTMVASSIAVVLAVPVSLGIALFVTEVTRHRFSGPVVAALDLLAATPSVVFGLWGLLVLAPKITGFYERVHDLVEPVPVLRTIFGPGAQGRSLMSAGIVLALMIVPIMTSIMREVIATVPDDQRNGALALGATRYEMIRGVVIPHSFGGLVGGLMLGLGRAMGETIAVALVIGGSAQVTGNLFKPGDAMPAVIVNLFGESSGTYRSALIALGVVLFAVTVLVNVVARWIVGRTELRMQGVAT